MNLKLSIILGFIFAALTDAADSATTNCTDNLQCSSCLCVSTNNSMTFTKGDTTTLCAHFVTVDNTSGCIVAYRAAYPVVVDTFSSIQLTGGQTNFQKYGFVEIVIQVYGTVMSVPLTYLQLTEFYSSAFSIIIELNNGVVQSAYWDHECATCSSSDCYQFTMPNGTLIDNICNSPSCISTNDSSCDPQIYVAWIGTDSKGNQLTSAGMRLSRFDQFSLSDIISSNTISPYVIPTPTNTTTNNSSGGNTTGAGNTTDTSGNKTDTNTTSGTTTNTTDTSGNKTETNTTTTNTTDTSGNKTDTNTTTTNTTDTSGNKTDTNTTTTNSTDTSGNKTDTNTTDTSGNKTDTNTTTTNTTDTSGNKTDTNTTTTNSTDTSGNKTDTNTTDTKTSTETSTSTSSGGSSSSTTDTGSSTSTGTDTSTKGDTTTTGGTDTSSSTPDTGSSTSTGTDTSTKEDTTTVTKL